MTRKRLWAGIFGVCLLSGACEPPGLRPSRVVLVTIDTLHVDWTGPYNKDVTTTPVLDRIASEGVRFDRAYTHVPITLPAHTAILTGIAPQTFGVLANGDEVPESAETLAERLGAAGYRTAAFISLGVLRPAFGLDQGFEEFADPFETDSSKWYRSADQVFDPAEAWITAHRDEPFFAWIHFSDPHEPYLPVNAPPDTELWLDDELLGRYNLVSMERYQLSVHLPPGTHRLRWVSLRGERPDDRPETAIMLDLLSPETLEERAVEPLPEYADGIPLTPDWEIRLSNADVSPAEIELTFRGHLERPAPSDVLENYGIEVAYTDRYIGEVDALLESLGIRDETLLVIVSDHGEGLYAHGLLGHASHVYEDQLRTVWLMRGPGLPPGHVVRDRPALLSDVAPTVLDVLGLEASSMEGRSWKDCWEGGRCPENARWWAFGVHHRSRRLNSVAGYLWPYKWMWQRSFPRSGYQVMEDPWEVEDLLAEPGPDNPEPLKRVAEAFPLVRRELAETLRRARRGADSEEKEELLRSLGYLGGAAKRKQKR